MSNKQRVVITGIGQISPLGNEIHAFRMAIAERRIAIGLLGYQALTHLPQNSTDAENSLPLRLAAEAREFTGAIANFGELDKERKRAIRKATKKLMGRECQFGVAAGQLALADAGFVPGELDPERIGTSYGSDYMITLPEEFLKLFNSCLQDAPENKMLSGIYDEQGREQVSFGSWWPKMAFEQMDPLWQLKYLPNMPASHLAIFNNLRGPSNSTTSREASACTALIEARQVILRGGADIMLVGATGTRVHPMRSVQAQIQQQITAAQDPRRASRPYDLERSGMVCGEGAGAMVIESLTSAQKRGVKIYAEVLDGATAISNKHVKPQKNAEEKGDFFVEPVVDPVINFVEYPNDSTMATLHRTSVRPKTHFHSPAQLPEDDYVSAKQGLVPNKRRALELAMSKTLRKNNLEPEQIAYVNGEGLGTSQCDIEEAEAIATIFGNENVPLTSLKGNFGNLGGGTGMVELIGSVVMLEEMIIPPTLGHHCTDPACPVDVVTEFRKIRGRDTRGLVLKCNVNQQAQAAAVVVGKFQE